ncbi:hypothetical protein CW556_22745 [Salmonella enterica]|nr:hypothetical protein [Salmonella enterica]EDJ8500373.1 hypothetical protein [Salmonella enterica]
MNLQEQDLQYGEQLYYRYPFSMVRALCVLWLFGGLRRDEILLSTTGKKWVFRNLGGRKLMKLFS